MCQRYSRSDELRHRTPDRSAWLGAGNKRKKLPLTIDKEDGRGARQFVFKLPSTTPAGDYPIDATVTWHQRVWKLHTVAHVLRPEPVAPPQPKQ